MTGRYYFKDNPSKDIIPFNYIVLLEIGCFVILTVPVVLTADDILKYF